MFKKIVFFFLLTFFGFATLVFAMSTDGKIVDIFGKNVTVSFDGLNNFKARDKVDLSYMADTMEFLIGQYEITQVKGNVFIAKEVSSTMSPSKDMKVKIVPAQNFFEGFGKKQNTSEEPSIPVQEEKEEGFLDKLGQMFRLEESGSDNNVPVEGEVVEVMGRDVKIRLTTDGTPKVGDAADLNYVTSGGKSLPVGTWQVKSVKGKEVIAAPLDGEGSPRKGLKAVIYKGDLQKKKAETSAASSSPWGVRADTTNRNVAATATATRTYPVEQATVPVMPQNMPQALPPVYADFNSFQQAMRNNQPFMIEQKWVLGVQIRNAEGTQWPDGTKFLSGVYIENVIPNTPAQKAGLLPGDVILHVDNISVKNVPEFMYLLSVSDGKVVLNIKRSPDLNKAIIKTVRLKKFEASLKVGEVSELRDESLWPQAELQNAPQAWPQAAPQLDVFQQQFPQVPVQQQWQGNQPTAQPYPQQEPQQYAPVVQQPYGQVQPQQNFGQPYVDPAAQQQQAAYNQALQQQQAAYNQAVQQQQAQQQAQQMQQVLKTMTKMIPQQQNFQQINEINGVENFNKLFQGVNNNAGFSLDPKNYFPPGLLNK
jgi:hypothetical protein